MDGGAVVPIGQGTYGCVFDPPLRCTGSKKAVAGKRRKVGKIGRSKEIKAEVRVSEILSDVPDANNMYVLADKGSMCKPAPIKKQGPDEQLAIEKCEAYKKWGLSDMLHYTMNFGGITIKKLEQRPIKEFPIYSFTQRLLTSTSYFLLKGLVHYDLHTGNILINPKTHMPVIIDFGMTFFVDDIQNASFLENIWTSFSAWANPEPPEITYITGIRKGMSSDAIIMAIMEEKPSLAMMDSVFKVSKLSQIKQLIDYIHVSKSIKARDWSNLFSKYWPVLDAWAVGGILIHFYKITMFATTNSSKGEFSRHHAVLKRVIKGLLSCDPRKRLDCLEALSILDPDNSLVTSAEGMAWLKERSKGRQGD